MVTKNTASARDTPHDTLVREHFQHPEHALGLLRVGLPAELFAQLKPETLRHKGIHLSTPALLKSVTDLVFTCQLQDGSDAFVHIVLEHKAYPDALVAVQVLKYMSLIWDHYRRKNPGNTRLPFVIPLIFYHGQEQWEPRSLHSLFPQDSPLLACVPVFTLPVCNLAKVPEEELRTHVFQNAMLLLLKAILEQETTQRIAQTLHLISATCSEADILDVLQLFFNYLAQVRPEITLDALDEELAKLPGGGNMGELFKERWAEYSFNRGAVIGRQEGIQEGMKAGASALVMELLSAQFGNIPPLLSEKLCNISNMETLRDLALAASKMESLDAFEALVDKSLGAPRQ